MIVLSLDRACDTVWTAVSALEAMPARTPILQSKASSVEVQLWRHRHDTSVIYSTRAVCKANFQKEQERKIATSSFHDTLRNTCARSLFVSKYCLSGQTSCSSCRQAAPECPSLSRIAVSRTTSSLQLQSMHTVVQPLQTESHPIKSILKRKLMAWTTTSSAS